MLFVAVVFIDIQHSRPKKRPQKPGMPGGSFSREPVEEV